MPNDLQQHDSRWVSLGTYLSVGILVTGAVLAVAFVLAEDRTKLAFGPQWQQNVPVAQLSFTLMALSLGYVFYFILITKEELQLLRRHIGIHIPRPPDLKIYTIVLSTVFALLAYFSDDPLVYAAVFLAMKGLAVYGHRVRRDILARAFDSLDEAHVQTKALDSIREYYLRRPHIRVVDLGPAALALGALVAAGSTRWFDNPIPDRTLLTVAYALLLSAFALQEGPIWFWRRKRGESAE